MSEENKAVEKVEKTAKKAGTGKLSKILKWFATLPQRIAKPFKNMWYELKKVSWPSKKKLEAYSIIVLLFMLFMGIVIGLLDMGSSAAVRAMIPGTAATETIVIEPEAELPADTAEAADAAADVVTDAAEETAAEAADVAADAAEPETASEGE